MKTTQGKGIGSKWQYKEARVELKKMHKNQQASNAPRIQVIGETPLTKRSKYPVMFFGNTQKNATAI
jgi:hypothetical protein